MVRLNKIYTKTGDDGSTSLVDSSRRPKNDRRVEAYGEVDETNATIGMARLYTADEPNLEPMLERIQNDLFDLGADLATPPAAEEKPSLRIVASQVERLEHEIDFLNESLAPLRSFVLPAGSPAATHLHLARTVARRAERAMVALAQKENVGRPALLYINRLSDFLFVASRYANLKSGGDVIWKPGKHR